MQRDIEIFRALMQTGSASKAADLLGISQPAISQSLQKFEAKAGLRLFERDRGRLIATAEAAALMQEVERSFVGLEAITHRMASLKQFGVGQLSVASYPAFGMGFLPRVLARRDFNKAHTAVSLQILSSQQVRTRVLSGQCDFGLMADEASTDGLQCEIFANVPGVVAIPVGHRLAAKQVITPNDLLKENFIALNPEDAARKRLDAMLNTCGVLLSPVVETPYAITICELVALGIGVGIVSCIAALDYINRGVVLRKFQLDMHFSCLLALPTGRPLSLKAQEFLKLMRLQLKEDQSKLNPLYLLP
jgi:DNA-binding transcriptional LysR family regulator